MNRTPHRSARTLRPAALVTALALAASLTGGAAAASSDEPGPDLSALGGDIRVSPYPAEGEPVSGGELVVGLESETNSYAPHLFRGSQAGISVAYAIYDPLMVRDGEGEVQPYLAESIEPNDDLTEWTLTLRSGISFHDGTPLDAEALTTIWNDYLAADGSLWAAFIRREVVGVEAVDDLTVRYTLTKPDAAWPDRLTGALGWPFSPTAAAELGEDFGSNPVGTGPFRFVSWQRDGELVVERNPDYWQDGQPYLDRITFRSIPDEETRATSLESGDIDVAQSVRLSGFLARVASIPDVVVELGPNNGGGVVFFNTVRPPFDDVRIRQALAYAVDQQTLIDIVAGDAAVATEPRTQFYWSEDPYYSEAVAEAWPTYDPERAAELYQQYVDDPERSDGKEPGEPVSFEYDCTNVPSLIEQATALQGFWGEVGFDVTVTPVEQSVHITEALTGDFDAKCYRLGTDQDPLVTIEAAFGDTTAFLTNYTDFQHETIDAAIETLRSTQDLATRQAAVEEVGLLLAEEMPIIWTGSDLPLFARTADVQGIASWTTPDGVLGDGAIPATAFWGQVWREAD